MGERGEKGEKKRKREDDTDTKERRKMIVEKLIESWNKMYCSLTFMRSRGGGPANFVGIKATDRIARFKYEVVCGGCLKKGIRTG